MLTGTRIVTRQRSGLTLLELMVGLVIGGFALALISAISVRQQRVFSDLAEIAAAGGQLRDAAGILPVDLRGISARLGDVHEARDTAIEFRATIASALVCDSAPAGLVLAPVGDSVSSLGFGETAVAIGDTAWLLNAADSNADWRAFRVSSVASIRGGSCASLAPALTAAERALTRVVVALDSAPQSTAAIGMPIRFTRSLRYSLYRASDGAWYLGERDWNAVTARFNTVQPVAGPFLSPAQRGLLLRYADSTGRDLGAPVGDTRNIVMVRMELRAATPHSMRALAASGAAKRTDSLIVAVLLRNR